MIIGLSLKSDQGSNCWATDLYWGHTGLPRSGPRPGREVTIRSAGQNAGLSFQWWFHHKENQSTEISPGDWSIKNGLPKLYDLIRRLAGFYGSVYGKAYVKPWLFRLFRLFWPFCGVSSGECVFFSQSAGQSGWAQNPANVPKLWLANHSHRLQKWRHYWGLNDKNQSGKKTRNKLQIIRWNILAEQGENPMYFRWRFSVPFFRWWIGNRLSLDCRYQGNSSCWYCLADPLHLTSRGFPARHGGTPKVVCKGFFSLSNGWELGVPPFMETRCMFQTCPSNFLGLPTVPKHVHPFSTPFPFSLCTSPASTLWSHSGFSRACTWLPGNRYGSKK